MKFLYNEIQDKPTQVGVHVFMPAKPNTKCIYWLSDLQFTFNTDNQIFVFFFSIKFKLQSVGSCLRVLLSCGSRVLKIENLRVTAFSILSKTMYNWKPLGILHFIVMISSFEID